MSRRIDKERDIADSLAPLLEDEKLAEQERLDRESAALWDDHLEQEAWLREQDAEAMRAVEEASHVPDDDWFYESQYHPYQEED